MATVDENSRGIYQIRTYDERIGLSFNQYLMADQKALLVHTGSVQMFDGMMQAMPTDAGAPGSLESIC